MRRRSGSCCRSRHLLPRLSPAARPLRLMAPPPPPAVDRTSTCIVLIAAPERGRLIAPLFRLYFAGDLPPTASPRSTRAAAIPDRTARSTASSSMTFPGWSGRPFYRTGRNRRPLAGRLSTYARLFMRSAAMPSTCSALEQLQAPGAELHGATDLRLDADRRIQREQVPTRFRKMVSWSDCPAAERTSTMKLFDRHTQPAHRRRAEASALDHLSRAGLRLVARNYRCRWRDHLIMRDRQTLSSSRCVTARRPLRPPRSADTGKQRRITTAAHRYICNDSRNTATCPAASTSSPSIPPRSEGPALLTPLDSGCLSLDPLNHEHATTHLRPVPGEHRHQAGRTAGAARRQHRTGRTDDGLLPAAGRQDSLLRQRGGSAGDARTSRRSCSTVSSANDGLPAIALTTDSIDPDRHRQRLQLPRGVQQAGACAGSGRRPIAGDHHQRQLTQSAAGRRRAHDRGMQVVALLGKER